MVKSTACPGASRSDAGTSATHTPRPPPPPESLLAATAVGLAGLTQALLYADHLIRDMYGFHINGFVINLVFTPGGESDVDIALEKLDEIRRKDPARYYVPAQFDNQRSQIA